jgi:hypothetical protein
VPNKSALDVLSPDDRKDLEREIGNRGFRDYDGLVDWLGQRGYEIGRSTVWRLGSKLKRRMEAVKASTEAARLVAEVAPDEADNRSAAVIAIVQSELFELLINLQEVEESADTAERVALMAKVSKGLADLTRASVGLKKWQAEVEARIRTEERAKLEAAAKASESIAKKAGLSDKDWAAIRANFLGVEVEE